MFSELMIGIPVVILSLMMIGIVLALTIAVVVRIGIAVVELCEFIMNFGRD